MAHLTVENQAGRTVNPLAAIEAADLADSTKTKYTRVLAGYLDNGGVLGDAAALGTYASTLSNSRRAQLKAAVKLWADQVVLTAKGSATPENINAVLATVARAEAMTEQIKVTEPKGEKWHTWLTQQEVKRLSNTITNGIVGARDRAVIGLMVAAGLRREEVVNLTFQDIQRQELKDRKTRTVLQIQGKGAKKRTVPISEGLAGDLQKWGQYVGHTGKVARALGRNREPSESMSAVALFNLARKYGARIGKPELAPHDLRRTYAQLAFDAGVSIIQISTLLGHESIETTQRYLNLALDLETTASDFIPW